MTTEQNQDNRVTITLAHPITFGSQMVTELRFRPLKAKDLRRMQAPPERSLAMLLELASFLSGETEQIIDELESDDLHKVLEVVGGFFAGSQPTGSE